MKIRKVGMRTIKTVLAVSFTIFISEIFKLRSPFFAAIAAIIAMQTSVSESLGAGKDRMYGTILGAFIALLYTLVAPENPFFIGIAIFIIIYICNLAGWEKSVSISTMVFLSIVLNYKEGSRLDYAFFRTLDTLIGLIIGTLINYFIHPPSLEDNIEESIDQMYKEFKNMVKAIIWKEENLPLEKLRKSLIDTEETYDILKSDIKLHLNKTLNSCDFDDVLESFESIYNHLSIIYTIDRTPNINEDNKNSLKKLFNNDIPPHGNDGDHRLDIIYNYHLEKILNQLLLIEKC